jgi:cytochrome c
VAKKYKGAFQIVGKLADKIIKGGGGVWGEQAMSAHPQVKKDEAEDMVRYILSLADEKAANKQPLAGTYTTETKKKEGSYVLTATYTDRGNGPVGPLTATQTLALRSAKVPAVSYDDKKEIMNFKLPTGGEAAIGTANGSYVVYNDIDLTGISGIKAMVFAADARVAGGALELRSGSPTGPVLGEAEVKFGTMGPVNIPFKKPESGTHKLYLVFVNPNAGGKPIAALMDLTFETSGM